MIKAWTEEAWEDFEYWTRQDRKVLKRILQLLKDIDRNGYEGIGKPERLSGDTGAAASMMPTALCIGSIAMWSKSFSAVHTIGISDAKQMACGLSAFLMGRACSLYLFTLKRFYSKIR